MALLRTPARVLRTYALGETSLIAVLLTEEAGLLASFDKPWSNDELCDFIERSLGTSA